MEALSKEKYKIKPAEYKKLLTIYDSSAIIIKRSRDARVVELADSLDSGSSAHSGRAGSSPASRTKQSIENVSFRCFLLFFGTFYF